ncbi:MAG TPA: hypothetical protein VND93_31440 [Myxococcales bacterium]|nr:hypothetical protein [Myxococcales bacterium]
MASFIQYQSPLPPPGAKPKPQPRPKPKPMPVTTLAVGEEVGRVFASGRDRQAE